MCNQKKTAVLYHTKNLWIEWDCIFFLFKHSNNQSKLCFLRVESDQYEKSKQEKRQRVDTKNEEKKIYKEQQKDSLNSDNYRESKEKSKELIPKIVEKKTKSYNFFIQGKKDNYLVAIK